MELLAEARATDMTKTVHVEPYAALSSSNPKLSQAGQVILITGGGTAIGNGIGRAFVRAAAKTVIIVGRRADVLLEGAERLKQEAQTFGTTTKILHYPLDITDFAAVDAFWETLAADGVVVDVLVSNAAMFTEPKPLLELAPGNLWAQMNVNVNAPFNMITKLYAQGTERQKFVINLTSLVIHRSAHPVVRMRPAYTLTKTTSTLLMQLLAQDVPVDKMQMVSFHPGQIFADEWAKVGFTPEMFDNLDLPANFAVWLATTNASFLHGRFAWSSWDIDELSTGEVRKRIDEDPYYLRVTVGGCT